MDKKRSGSPVRFMLGLSGMILISALVLAGCYHIKVGEPVPLEQPKPSLPAAAAFSFGAIEVSPLPVTAGQTMTVSMTIENTSASSGSYKADLVINNTNIDSKAVTVAPKTRQQVQFQTTLSTAGRYELKIGPQTKTIDITEKRVQATLKISGDAVDGFDPLVGSTSDPSQMQAIVEGHLIKLTAPPAGFVITNIRIMGFMKNSTYDFNHDPVFGPGVWVYGTDIAVAEPLKTYFTVTIWDARHNRLYSGEFNNDLFTYTPGWVTVDIPPTSVTGDFFIEVNTFNQPRLNARGWGNWAPGDWGNPWYPSRRYVVHTWYNQLYIGYQNAIEVQSWSSQNGSIVPDRYFTYNWLIQATGYTH